MAETGKVMWNGNDTGKGEGGELNSRMKTAFGDQGEGALEPNFKI